MFTGVNTLFNALMNHPISRRSISPVEGRPRRRHAVLKAVADRWKKMTGCTLSGPTVCGDLARGDINPLDLEDTTGRSELPISSTE